MRILIKHGVLVNAYGKEKADILIEDGQIIKIENGICQEDAQCIDAKGCFVFPGFIDTHTHLDLDLGVTTTADKFPSGTRAALLGGTTTVLDFATQDRGMTMHEALDAWHKKAQGSSCNYGFHMAITEWNERLFNEMADMEKQGITSYKMYMVYPALRTDDGEIYCALKRARELDALIGMHCENWEVLQRMIAEQKALGNLGPTGHPLSRPGPIEAEAVNRYLRIAELAGAPAYVVHLSTAEGLLAGRAARERKQEVYLETCPQYLVLDDERYSDADGAKFVMSPPLRKALDNERLWNGLHANEIDTVGTDHCSFTMAQKAIGADDFSKIPNGAAGVQNRAALYYTYGVDRGLVSLEQMAAQLALNAAKIFGMYPRKGIIAVGSDADIVIWDPAYTQTISYKTLAHDCDNSPYEGMSTKGRARDVLLGGEWAVRNGVLTHPGLGKYVHRAKPLHDRAK